MCGIAGALNWAHEPNVEAVALMTEALEHRGPDASGIFHQGPIALGHRRLSIIDVEEVSNQPLLDNSGQIIIVFNGEIYNFIELRSELKSLGACFRTNSDTEVILESYKIWGVECLSRLDGMFAFALWDNKKHILLLARDRFGEKPLFYTMPNSKSIVFASEPRVLGLHPNIHKCVDEIALSHYLSLNYTVGERSLYKDILRLQPAQYMLLSKERKPQMGTYWNLADHYKNKKLRITEDEAEEELSFILDRAVSSRMMSDVPLGAFLSGGIDSASIVAAMKKSSIADSINTFSIGFNQDSYSEIHQARQTANHLQVNHHEEVIDPSAAEIYQALVKASDEPIADTSMLPTYYLAKFASKSVKVVLSGDGGDECFAGYETYSADQYHAMLKYMPNFISRSIYLGVEKFCPVSFQRVSLDYKIRHFLSGLSLNSQQAHYSWRNIFTPSERDNVMSPEWRDRLSFPEGDAYSVFERYFSDVAECDLLDQMMYVDMKTWLPDDILVKLDRSTMANSLESRAPFLDYRLVEFAASLPVKFKIKTGSKKYLLKKSQATRLPNNILMRKKQGFNAPVSYWLNDSMKTLMLDILSDNKLYEWLSKDMVEILLKQHLDKKRDNSLKLLGIMSFGLWLNQN